MLTTLLLSTLVLATATDVKPAHPSQIRGLDPKNYDHYNPSSINFTCLDGSITIPFTSINDNYCDCPDGSDEPGTSACANSYFWCNNVGHEGGWVLSSRVGDGICDPECCDGSDEWESGACPDRCAEIGQKFREERETKLRTRRTGSKIRSTYIKWAKTEKTRLEDELAKKKLEVVDKEKEVETSRILLEKIEARSKEDVEKRKQSPLYTTLLTHRLALTRLRSKTSKLQAELDQLHGILEDLVKGYNPNGQDMAVKAAVVGYEEITRVPIIDGQDVDGEGQGDADVEEIGDSELDELERKDLEGLLLSEDVSGGDADAESEGGILYRIDEYIPDALYDSWESVRDFAIDWLIKVGVLGRGSKGAAKVSIADGPHVSAARDKHTTANNELNRLNGIVKSTTETIEKFGTGYGPQAEWKKLDGTCIDKVAGDYTYELCFLGRATQKSNKDSSQNHLGTFTDWNTASEIGSFDYYTRQNYRNGAKCWNGPMRSVTVDITCGLKNELLSIQEPEKCEYFFKVTSPALCWPVEEQEGAVKEEL